MRFRLALPAEGVAKPVKYSFGRRNKFGFAENKTAYDEQTYVREAPLVKRGENERVAGSGAQPARVVTLASLSPDVLTAVNGAFLAGDGMKRPQTADPSARTLFNRFGHMWSIDGNSALPLNHLSPRLPSTRTDGSDMRLTPRMTPAAPEVSEGAQDAALAESAPRSFFSEVQTVDSLGRPAVTNRITGQADPAGTVRFTASESRSKVGDQP